MKVEMPVPNMEEQQLSNQLKQMIVNEINASHGYISFERYMNACLYTKKLGYYESGREIFGETGDFVTSPESSQYFALAFAAHLQKIHETLGEYSIIEIGAGSGQFSVDLIKYLDEFDCLPAQYLILEKSEALKVRQKKLLEQVSNVKTQIKWIDEVNKQIESGVVIANEVLDAMPVRIVNIKNQSILERCVGLENDGLVYVDVPAVDDLKETVSNNLPTDILNNSNGEYVTEVNLRLNDFVEQIASFVKQGVFFYVDYGYPRDEYYHATRTMGTMICHYRHTANEYPLSWPGLQDITCNVDFTALAEAAVQADLQMCCYCTQAHFLLASNFLTVFPDKINLETIGASAEIKKLIMPGEMGERFQVMVLTKGLDLEPTCFTTRDLTHRL